jgi:hypothetical protein
MRKTSTEGFACGCSRLMAWHEGRSRSAHGSRRAYQTRLLNRDPEMFIMKTWPDDRCVGQAPLIESESVPSRLFAPLVRGQRGKVKCK